MATTNDGLELTLAKVINDFDAWWAAETRRLVEHERCSIAEVAEVLGTSVERIEEIGEEISRAADDGFAVPAATQQPRADL